eukprot:g361.t1
MQYVVLKALRMRRMLLNAFHVDKNKERCCKRRTPWCCLCLFIFVLHLLFLLYRSVPYFYVYDYLQIGRGFFMKRSRLGHRIAQLCGTEVSPWLDYTFSDGCNAPPVFVVGCGHSGTTLLRRLIGQHPEVYDVRRETRLFHLSPCQAEIKMAKIRLRCSQQGKQRWIEKTPSHIRSIPRMFDQVSNARIISLVRDGRDVALSIKRRMTPVLCDASEEADEKVFSFVKEATELGRTCEEHVFVDRGIRRWVESNTAFLAFLEKREWEVPSFRESGLENRNLLRQITNQLSLLRYEDLVHNPNETVTEIVEFLWREEDGGDKISLSRKTAQAMISSASSAVNMFVYASDEEWNETNHQETREWEASQPIKVWKAGVWKEDLSQREIELFNNYKGAKELLQKFGYK